MFAGGVWCFEWWNGGDNRAHLLAVADGLGGHAAGEVASKLAVIELVETVKRRVVASLLRLHQRYTEG